MGSALPLFNWQIEAEQVRLQHQREQLFARIRNLKPHSHRRLELEARLREITARQMELEHRIESGARR